MLLNLTHNYDSEICKAGKLWQCAKNLTAFAPKFFDWSHEMGVLFVKFHLD